MTPAEPAVNPRFIVTFIIDQSAPYLAACCYSCVDARDIGHECETLLRCVHSGRTVRPWQICRCYRPVDEMDQK